MSRQIRFRYLLKSFMKKEGTVDLLKALLQTSDSDHVIFITVEILWNMLASEKQKRIVAEKLGTLVSFYFKSWLGITHSAKDFI